MENKQPEDFWSFIILYHHEPTSVPPLNHFIFQKFIPCIYDVEHYKHLFRNHNNLVIPKAPYSQEVMGSSSILVQQLSRIR
jgi:hypothetical protein